MAITTRQIQSDYEEFFFEVREKEVKCNGIVN